MDLFDVRQLLGTNMMSYINFKEPIWYKKTFIN